MMDRAEMIIKLADHIMSKLAGVSLTEAEYQMLRNAVELRYIPTVQGNQIRAGTLTTTSLNRGAIYTRKMVEKHIADGGSLDDLKGAIFVEDVRFKIAD